MPRNISVRLTQTQVEEQAKTVTRRLGWLDVKVNDVLQPVDQVMGLKLGARPTKIGPTVTVIQVTREHLHRITYEECIREGFPDLQPKAFIEMFCKAHPGCTADTMVTRIEWRYDAPSERMAAYLKSVEG